MRGFGKRPTYEADSPNKHSGVPHSPSRHTNYINMTKRNIFITAIAVSISFLLATISLQLGRIADSTSDIASHFERIDVSNLEIRAEMAAQRKRVDDITKFLNEVIANSQRNGTEK